MRAICPICPRVETDQGTHFWTGGPMTLDESIQGMRLQVIRRATQIGGSRACTKAGISRTLFYRWQHRLSRYGVDDLHPRRLQARPGRPPQLAPAVERPLLAVAIAEATWGAQRLAAYAQRLWRLRVAASTVPRLLRRHGLATRRQRLLVLEHHSALQWGDVDFNSRFIQVRRNLVGGRETTPKSGKTRRVDMSIQLTETLRTLLTARKAEALKKGWGTVPDWVFCSEDGKPLDGDNLRHRVFYRVLAKAGL